MKLLLSSAIVIAFVAAAGFSQCPVISVSGPSGLTQPGENMEFRVDAGVVGPKLTYSWSVTAGTIIEGQGTDRIKVNTDRSIAGTNVTATVSIEGLASSCINSASGTALVDMGIACGLSIDDWGKLKPNEERGRLDAFLNELANNPTNQGIITLRITSRERLDSGNARVQFILKHLRFREFDANRVWFALELSEEPRTVLWRVPSGADVPCDKCLLIRDARLQR